MPVQTLTLGEETAFVAIPGELGVDLAERLRAASPFAKNVFVTNANDYIGYVVPETPARERVTYQAKGMRFDPRYGTQIIDGALSLLDPDHEPSAPLGPASASGSISGTVAHDGPNGVAVGVKRMPSPPNYTGGFWGRRTVAGPDGRWQIDSLAAGTLYLHAAGVDPQNPAPVSMKSGYRDLDTLMYGRPVQVEQGEATEDITLRLGSGDERTGVRDLAFVDGSVRAGPGRVTGRLRVEGTPGAPIRVSAHPAELRYRKLETFLSDPLAATTVRSNGRSMLGGLPPGRYRLSAWLDVNENDLPEPDGLDVVPGPQNSPVVEVSASAPR